MNNMIQDMATDSDILEAISEAIKRHGDREITPPFNEEQLVIMAILSLQKAATPREIFDWILANFWYYQLLARTALWVQPYCHDRYVPQEGRSAADFRQKFAKVFWQYEVPLITESGSDGTLLYNITATNGRERLASALGVKTVDKVFPFFDLPPEIRNSIYEYTFQYPSSGIMVVQVDQQRYCRGLHGDRQLAILSRSASHAFGFEKWDKAIAAARAYPRPNHDPQTLRSMPLRTVLAPLLTSRQFYEEAMPLFYSLNRFYFDHPIDIFNTLHFLHPNRRKYITHVAFNLPQRNRSRDVTVAAFKVLLGLERLCKLDIRVAPGAATAVKGPNARGLHTLCKLRGMEEVTMTGDCEKIRAMVVGHLMLPKDDGAGSSKKRKRKSSTSEVEEHEGIA